MIMLLELAAVLVPWLVPAIVAPVLLYAVRLAVRLIETGSNARKKYLARRFFQQYTQRGFY